MPATDLELLSEFFARSAAAGRALRVLSPAAVVGLELEEGPVTFSPAGARFAPGRPADPDFTLRLPPAAVRRLCADTDAGLGALGVHFFSLVVERDSALKVGVHIDAPTTRLLSRNYLAVLALGGAQVAFWLLRRGLADPRAAVEKLRRRSVRPAEPGDPGARPGR